MLLWFGFCRKDTGTEARLLQNLQEMQEGRVDHRLALLESTLVQSMDSSSASQSGLAHRLSSGLLSLRQSITQDKANQVTKQEQQ